MNRPIKFRVWNGMGMEYDVVVGKLGAFYAHRLDPNDTACIETTTIYSDTTPVMQFTGLLDKQGKEIYEGDIYQVTGSDWRGVVKWREEWDDCECSFAGYSFHVINPKLIEIIGNIYENPELLNN